MVFFFFFQAEDGIRDLTVTGVQTCALPIWGGLLLGLAGFGLHFRSAARRRLREYGGLFAHGLPPAQVARSVGAEQGATAGVAVIAGCALGVALALAVLPVPPPAAALAGLAA